ncbi:hypothetical protein GGR57DRAFT_241227 [Xylariaceae sp. FL1272]|nr:hypothetical protein GGR57DRAFT_241227 [Xylariaceae sp. FL1272]
MQFSTVIALFLPIVAANAQATNTTSSAAPTSTADLEAICESQAGPYTEDCPRCLSRCATSAYVKDCFYSTFFTVNGIESDCEAHGGSNCKGKALDQVCPQ